MKTTLSLIAAAALCLATVPAHSTPVTVDLEDVTNGGGFFAQVLFEDVAANTVKVTADITDTFNASLTQGDILGLWMDISDETKLPGISFQNESPAGIITASSLDANNVGWVGSANNNLNGSGETGWDIGLALGSNGGPDFFQNIMFEMTTAGLTASMFGDRVGMPVQSIEGGAFDSIGSSKLIGGGGGGTTGGGNGTVAEPEALWLLGIGLVGLGFTRRIKAA